MGFALGQETNARITMVIDIPLHNVQSPASKTVSLPQDARGSEREDKDPILNIAEALAELEATARVN